VSSVAFNHEGHEVHEAGNSKRTGSLDGLVFFVMLSGSETSCSSLAMQLRFFGPFGASE